MAAPNLNFVVVEHPELKGEPLIVGEEEFRAGDFSVWTGEMPEGLRPVRNKTEEYLPKKAPKKAAKK